MGRRATGTVVERRGKRGVSYGLRFRAWGARHYVTAAATTRAEAEVELQNILADVRRGIWRLPMAAAPEPELPAAVPTFHRFASEWLEARTPELQPRTIENLEWALSHHLLPHFARLEVGQITIADVDRYRQAEVRARANAKHGERTLSNRSINATLRVLAQILDDAIEQGLLAGANPARGRKRRAKAGKPRRTWLSIDELRDLLAAASDDRRPLIALMALAGLRVSEACALTWGAVDLANSRLRVLDSKTDAGVRIVDIWPALQDELVAWKARSETTAASDLVFTSKLGTARNRHTVRADVLQPTIKSANTRRIAAGKPAIVGLTNHGLRRTFCALLYEDGQTPDYVMSQMGHTSATLALEVYSRVVEQKRNVGGRVDKLLRGPYGHERAQTDAEAFTDADAEQLLQDADAAR